MIAAWYKDHGYNFLGITEHNMLQEGEFWVDIDQFADRDFSDTTISQNDLDVPNKVVEEGDVFGFDYRLECYTPAPKRTYGYFTLPILRRGALVGRLDPKAHRKDGIFEVKSLYLEQGVEVTDELVADIASALRECAAWHRTPKVVVRRSEPKRVAALLRKALA